jgi:hypothetical protein
VLLRSTVRLRAVSHAAAGVVFSVLAEQMGDDDDVAGAVASISGV